MATSLALEDMTIEEKLQVMEALWADLCQHEEALPVHEWQKKILDRRETLIAEGKTRFIDWEESKKRIEKETS
ncbi:MAG: addiction module protein [Pyrinomonadaceae bacterium]